MSALEQAYNRGVSDATNLLRFTASQMPPRHAIPASVIVTLADTLDELKYTDPPPPEPSATAAVGPLPAPAPILCGAAAEAVA